MASQIVTGPPAHYHDRNGTTNEPKSGCYDLGWPGHTTVGQVFVVPGAYNRLEAARFWWRRLNYLTLPGFSAAQVSSIVKPKVRAYLYAWDHAQRRATGTALWSSAPFDGPDLRGGASQLELSTGGVAVTPGARYVLVLSLSEHAAANPCPAAFLGADAYNGPPNPLTIQLAHASDGPNAWTEELAAYRVSTRAESEQLPNPDDDPAGVNLARGLPDSEADWTGAAWRWRHPVPFAFEADLTQL